MRATFKHRGIRKSLAQIIIVNDTRKRPKVHLKGRKPLLTCQLSRCSSGLPLRRRDPYGVRARSQAERPIHPHPTASVLVADPIARVPIAEVEVRAPAQAVRVRGVEARRRAVVNGAGVRAHVPRRRAAVHEEDVVGRERGVAREGLAEEGDVGVRGVEVGEDVGWGEGLPDL